MHDRGEDCTMVPTMNAGQLTVSGCKSGVDGICITHSGRRRLHPADPIADIVNAELVRADKGFMKDTANMCRTPEANPASPTERTIVLEMLLHVATVLTNEVAPFFTGRQTSGVLTLASLSAISVNEQGGRFNLAAVPSGYTAMFVVPGCFLSMGQSNKP